MPSHPLVDASGVEVDATRLQAFTSSFRGAVIRAGDAHYDVARRIWNASIDKYPGLIARCTGLADVIAAVRFARENRLLVAVRDGGHNVGGRAVCEGGIPGQLLPGQSEHPARCGGRGLTGW
jgi:FAD binding domain